MNAINQLGLFDNPPAIEVAKNLPKWFRVVDLSRSMGFKSNHGPEFLRIWYSEVMPHLEERKHIYPRGKVYLRMVLMCLTDDLEAA